jgi:hypothetical protein
MRRNVPTPWRRQPMCRPALLKLIGCINFGSQRIRVHSSITTVAQIQMEFGLLLGIELIDIHCPVVRHGIAVIIIISI